MNYLKYPHALDAHSSYHVLHEIPHPTLIVAGMLDVLTPAYHSFEMLARMPRAELLCFTLGTHFVLLEYPEEIGGRIFGFLADEEVAARKAKRKEKGNHYSGGEFYLPSRGGGGGGGGGSRGGGKGALRRSTSRKAQKRSDSALGSSPARTSRRKTRTPETFKADFSSVWSKANPYQTS
ncbi:hypothetical protein TrRE_jg7316 [Triparma retinervis]|uniref:Uncharacterized protein n=1 Tax=Triparma retinervis TaxID=2557542 RepID=A0A9W6ZJU5_9STRA|nr:hypothetical protein TrRE_jg7316 [Triparma retinervis]